MAEIAAISTEVPPCAVSAEDSKAQLASLLPERTMVRLPGLVDESRIKTRYAVAPLPELAKLQTIEARNSEFLKHGASLAESVARKALCASGAEAEGLNTLISVGSTSYTVPSLETVVMRRLSLPPTCRRIPISQLGCSGGLGALNLAAELVGADVTKNVLVVCVELPSLSLPIAEPALSDVLASTLLGDGAAAALVSGGHRLRGPEIVDTRSLLFPETAEGGGARLTDAGFRMVPAVGLPRVARRRLPGAVGEFLAGHGARPEDLAFWIVNPRSPQILEAIGESLDLPEKALAPSWAAWERFGSTISATVFFILEELQRSHPPASGSLGLMLSLGAGVTCEMALLRWHDLPSVHRS